MIPLMLGALLAAGALVYVLWPLVHSADDTHTRTPVRATERAADDGAIRALREIEFDRATGKLSATDYEQLKDSYTSRAVAELRAQESAGSKSALGGAASGTDDPVEAMIRRARAASTVCWQCSTTCPESDAMYCSTCGAYLPGSCTHCNAQIHESGARFCTSCGWGLVGRP